MKRILSVFLVLIAVLTLVACGEKEEPRTYMADGQYTAFVAHDNYGKPQLTWVTVTIENDEIKSFYIDQLQSNSASEWKSQTKKELGFGYRMHGQYDLSEDDYVAYFEEKYCSEGLSIETLLSYYYGVTLEEARKTWKEGLSSQLKVEAIFAQIVKNENAFSGYADDAFLLGRDRKKSEIFPKGRKYKIREKILAKA